ncbi:T9SS type A sorting domain-containing protein, partial [Bacteroidales bacterium OttesenSCG-928-E04]|nr:T9SS type A sorting domain-containing protein [Bacteroidales bacterium OttesenSCG-928-E04]
PFFHINVLTASGQPAIPGAKNSYFLVNPQGSSPSPNPEVSLPETAYNFCEASDQYLMHQWIQWIPVAFDLRNRIGEQVKLQVTTQDCMPSAHYAYGYFAARGVNGSMRVSACDSDNIFLTVPSGFESYKWYCNGAPLPVAASHELKRERDSTATYFECKAVSYTGAIISFTATVNYNEILPDGTLIADTICEGNDYWFGGEYLTSSGIYTDTLQNAHGCNSVTTLNLTVIPRLGEIGSIQGDANITEPGTYSYSIPAVENAIHYQWKVSNNKWIISDSGNNASVRIDSSGSGIVSVWVSNNCDTITSQLSIHADITSIPTHTPHGISFYPNPTYGEVEVKIENPNLNVSGIDIYDVYGKWLKRVQVTSSLTKVSLSEYANGTYLLRIATDDTPAGVFKVVKR